MHHSLTRQLLVVGFIKDGSKDIKNNITNYPC